MKYFICLFIIIMITGTSAIAQQQGILQDNITWTSQSISSSGSMPCGGGDIGLNVWLEHGDLLFYIARSGTYDENNALLKLGRVRVHLSSNPFTWGSFKQTLDLQNGCVNVEGAGNGQTVSIKVWVDVFSPQIHVDINSSKRVAMQVGYESWRYKDTEVKGLENNENGYKFGATGPVKNYKDNISFTRNGVLFFHRNKNPNIFDVTVKQQGLDSIKNKLTNPLKNLVFGGILTGDHLSASGIYSGKYINTNYRGWRLNSTGKYKNYKIKLCLSTRQTPDFNTWKAGLDSLSDVSARAKNARAKSQTWWKNFWSRSFIFIDPYHTDTSSQEWQAGRNYQLFRYMLACNAFGKYPTKFNGGLFTYDPVLVNKEFPYTPDFRNWGGSIFTAQNQRLVYFPMLKNGDFDVIKPEFDFYAGILNNAKLATKAYWHHGGARFPEQIENFGLSDYAEYGVNRPETFDPGVDYNAWLEYHWETVLEFCYMMLEYREYSGKSIQPYLPLIINCIDFFDLHYSYLAKLRGIDSLDGSRHLVIFPGSAGETFKMSYNSTSTIAGLTTVLKALLALPANEIDTAQRSRFLAQLKRIPPLNYQAMAGHQTIAPAKSWERINNEESPQLYPLFPYGIFGINKPGLDIALNTWKYDTTVVKFRSYVGWKQDNIFAARLGLTSDAACLTFAKLRNSGRRFPAFWGPGFDWVPDHNWGGSGMTGLQEMLLQTAGDKIYLFPAWPKNIDVHFKLNAPHQTTVECSLRNGVVEQLIVTPASRKKDVVITGSGSD